MLKIDHDQLVENIHQGINDLQSASKPYIGYLCPTGKFNFFDKLNNLVILSELSQNNFCCWQQ